ncbi:MAG: alpha/beta hydrolase [Myxococcota bacterium]
MTVQPKPVRSLRMRILIRVLIGIGVFSTVITLLVSFAVRDLPARSAFGERRIAISGRAEIHYFVSGPASESVVALIPSYARSSSDFNELVRALNQAGHRTLAMQLRGIDGSSLTPLAENIHVYATDLAAILDAEKITRPAFVLGHAYGNRVARAFGVDFPERTKALILLAAGGDEPSPPEISRAITQALFRIYPEDTRRAAIELAFFAEGNVAPEHWLRGWYPAAGIVEGMVTAASEFEEWGSGGVAPILVLQPGEDAVAAASGARLAKRFPGRVRLTTIAGAGHALLPEQPGVVSRVVIDYLESQRRTPHKGELQR